MMLGCLFIVACGRLPEDTMDSNKTRGVEGVLHVGPLGRGQTDEVFRVCIDGVEYLQSLGNGTQTYTVHVQPDGKPYLCHGSSAPFINALFELLR